MHESVEQGAQHKKNESRRAQESAHRACYWPVLQAVANQCLLYKVTEHCTLTSILQNDRIEAAAAESQMAAFFH